MTTAVVWTRLNGDEDFLKECIVILYKLQTSHEKLVKSTTMTNQVGFNKADAPFLSKLAENIENAKNLIGRPYTEDDLIIAKEKMLKYSRQVANIFNSNGDGVA